MEFDTTNWPTIVQDFGTTVNRWLATVDPGALSLAFLALVVVVFLRRKISDWIVEGTETLLKRFSVTFSDEVTSQLKVGVRTLVVTFAIYLALEAVNPPELIAGLLGRILISVALIVVFATWYQLSGPFVSVLVADKVKSVTMEAGWVQRISQFAIMLFGLTALLKVWQVDISGALTGVGVLGAGLAIATQDLIRNFVAGMTNMSEKRFESGDAKSTTSSSQRSRRAFLARRSGTSSKAVRKNSMRGSSSRRVANPSKVHPFENLMAHPIRSGQIPNAIPLTFTRKLLTFRRWMR